VIGLDEDDGWGEEGWVGALDAGRPHESGGGGGRGRGGRGARGARDAGDGRDEAEEDSAARPEDWPWTPIPRQAKAERGLIPPQRRLKKTSRSA
jgi:hypothetical protein